MITRIALVSGVLILTTATADEVRAQEPATTLVRQASDLRPMRRGDRPPDVGGFSSSRADFRLLIDGQQVPYSVLGIRALPGQRLSIQARPGVRVALDPAAPRTLRFRSGQAEVVGPGEWVWQSPVEPGPTALRVTVADRGVHLNVFVMHPRSVLQEGRLLGYRVGAYVQPRAGGTAPPRPAGFVAVRAADEDILLSPHFTIGQFQCKDPGNPKAFLFTRDLLIKLEVLLEAVNAEGFPTPSLHIMSGYRTPAYNRAIGNTTTQSRHLYGDAADVFVDVDGNGMMDDLNEDGASDRADVQILARIMERLEQQGRVAAGGLSVYRRAPHRGPFLHVDARGRRARW